MRSGAYYFVDQAGKWLPLGKSYPEALAELAKHLQQLEPAGTIAALITRYEAEELPRVARATQVGRRQQFKVLRRVFGHMRAYQVEPHHVWNYYRKAGQTVQARHEVAGLSVLLTFARHCGDMKTPNPCFGLQLQGAPPRARYVTDVEFLTVRDVAQPMIGFAMDLALLAGMDSGTIRSLERRHLTDTGIQFTRPKTGELQHIAWSEELRLTVQAILREAPQLRRALICTRQGKAYTSDGFQAQWQRTLRKAKKAGLADSFHFHDLRAKSASDDATDQGAADRLGHADVNLTRRVYRRLPRSAAALVMVRDK